MNKPFQKDNTMNFIVDDHLYAVSTDGCDCIVHTEKGDFRHKDTWNRQPEKVNCQLYSLPHLQGHTKAKLFQTMKRGSAIYAKKIVKRIAKLTLAMLYRLCNGILLAT